MTKIYRKPMIALSVLLVMPFINGCSIKTNNSSYDNSLDVYIFSGQSNMEGLGKVSELSNDHQQAIEGAWFWNGKLFETLDPFKTILSFERGRFGPELNFARTMNKYKLNRNIYIIKYSSSGKALDSGWNDQTWIGAPPGPGRWNFYPGQSPDDNNKGICYNQMMDTINSALNNLQQQDLDYTIKAIVWVQGEQDSKNEISASRYAKNLKKFHQRLCQDLNIDTKVMLYSELLPHEPPASRFTHRNEIRLSQIEADCGSGHADSIGNAYMVKTEGCPVYDDLVHYTTKGQLILGERLAKEMLNTIKN